MIKRIWPYVALLLMGAGWGATVPLTKIAVSTGHMQFGLIFWQLVVTTIVLGAIMIVQGRKLVLQQGSIKLFLVIALTGTIFPNTISYTAAQYLPASILAILIATVPMWAYPIAIFWKMDAFDTRRLGGLIIGILAVAILVLPDTPMLDRSVLWMVPIALIGPFFYSIEGNYIAKFGTLNHGPIETLFGASVIGMGIVGPIAYVSGQWFFLPDHIGVAEQALIGSSVLHGFAYAGYVALVGYVGSVFAAQVSYAVTIFGVFWSMFLPNENQSPYLWAALLCMMLGMSLVSPRKRDVE